MFGPEFGNDDMPLEYRQARDEAFGELKRIVSEILKQDIETTAVRRAALAGWSYTHGLASLIIHGVLQFPATTTDKRFVDNTLQGFQFLFEAGSQP